MPPIIHHTVAAIVALGIWGTEAGAWGVDGHQAVAIIAANFMAQSTADEVGTLLGGHGSLNGQMMDAAVWADEKRAFRPETGPWHFVNIPLSATGFDMQRDCAAGNCIVAALDRYANILRDRRLEPSVRAEALRFIIHFMADVAQPLHASDNHDHGGNALQVVIGGVRRSLHQVWDTDLVQAVEQRAGVRGGRALGVWMAARITAQQRQAWATGGPVDWANQSHDVAVRSAYSGISGSGSNDPRNPVILGPQYLAQAVLAVEGQLAVAGVRLAAELDMLLRR